MNEPEPPVVEQPRVERSPFSQMLADNPSWMPYSTSARVGGRRTAAVTAAAVTATAAAVCAALAVYNELPTRYHSTAAAAARGTVPSDAAAGLASPVVTATVRVAVAAAVPRAPSRASRTPEHSRSDHSNAKTSPAARSGRTAPPTLIHRRPVRAAASTPVSSPYRLSANGRFRSTSGGVIAGSVDVTTNVGPVHVVFHASGPRSVSAAMAGGGGRFTVRVRVAKSGSYRTWATVTAGRHQITTSTRRLVVSV